MFHSSELVDLPKTIHHWPSPHSAPRSSPFYIMHFRECGGRGGGGGGGERANGEEGGREAGKQARSLGHLIQLLAILLWDHYTAWLLSQSARLLAAACTLYRMLLSGRWLEFLPDMKQIFEMVTCVSC